MSANEILREEKPELLAAVDEGLESLEANRCTLRSQAREKIAQWTERRLPAE